jgi:hypothetical protein
MSLRTVLIIDDRKLKQMTKDLVIHLDLFAIENSKIKRLDHTAILYKSGLECFYQSGRTF